MDLIRKFTDQTPRNSIDPYVFLQAASIYHQFPSVGSVRLFPRRNLGSRSTLKSANLQLIEPDFIDSLKINWNESFKFLFNRWIVGDRQTFYLCSTHFTIIFINLSNNALKTTSVENSQKNFNEIDNKSSFKLKGAQKRKRTLFENKTNCIFSSSPIKDCTNTEISSKVNYQPRIVITPTTSGFRQILQKNGINFTLPFKSDFIALTREESPTDFLPNEEDSTSNLDHDEWLKEIGISPKGSLRLKQSASELDISDLSNSLPASELTRMSATSDSPPMDSLRSTIIIKQAQQYGYNDVFIFDRQENIGGVWQMALDPNSKSQWLITWIDLNTNLLYEEEFDAVLICTGMHSKSWRPPEYRLEKQFKGQIIHSDSLGDLKKFHNKTVCIVGFGNSALEIVQVLAPITKQYKHMFIPELIPHNNLAIIGHIQVFLYKLTKNIL
ncbi:hypothetical protein Mgra_00000146 [Meloidogyne graminicola]|uniref:Flavin-containing monooxygenase n=1 Tax=Meloidogyne graminicola TaxID=189291 RepID=A0A8T0A4N5_9BILA|nr:hypothetical protein Mgra_00000146 [Meloidogyne graminicola]